jgi:uncharacterized membrane protein
MVEKIATITGTLGLAGTIWMFIASFAPCGAGVGECGEGILKALLYISLFIFIASVVVLKSKTRNDKNKKDSE